MGKCKKCGKQYESNRGKMDNGLCSRCDIKDIQIESGRREKMKFRGYELEDCETSEQIEAWKCAQ